jgi:hypothetical protein
LIQSLPCNRAGDGFELHERRRLEDGGRRVVKDVELIPADGAPRRWREDVRLYDSPELDALLAAAGLQPREAYGDFDGTPPGPAAPRRIVLADRI